MTDPKPKPLRVDPVPTLTSWWANCDREELDTRIKQQQARMSAARITGRVSVPEGWR